MITRTKLILLVLFFGSLIGVWWAEYAKIPTAEQRRRMAGRVVPELIDVPVKEVSRVEISGGPEGLVAFQHEPDGHWQMTAPVDAIAEPSAIESLVRNLKTLKPVPGAESLRGDAKTFGFDPPERTVRLFGANSASPAPLVALEIGKTVESRRYVREAGAGTGLGDIEVVDARLLAGIDRPAVDWRDRALFSLSTFEVESLAVKGADRDLEAKRSGGRWQLLRPFPALADSHKLEGMIADVASLRVADGAKGYVADNVRDFAPYGLDKPSMTITLASGSAKSKPQVLEIGKAVPDVSERAYARIAGQDDVIRIETKTLHDLGLNPKQLRIQRIADFDPSRIDFIDIEIAGEEHIVAKGPDGWEIFSPSPGRADTQSIQTLLTKLNEIETSEFLEPSAVPNSGLEKPSAIVRIWQGGLASISAGAGDSLPKPASDPILNLRLGKHNVIAKVVYAQTAGDSTVLTLPDLLVPLIPKNALSYRDRNLMFQDPNRIWRLKVLRSGTTYWVEETAVEGQASRWRMLSPTEAPADSEAVTRLAVMLAHLRADTLVTDKPDDFKTYGLDAPLLSVTWEARANARAPRLPKAPPEPIEWTLQVGKEVPRKQGYHFAHLAGNPIVFILSPAAVQLLDAELRDRRVFGFQLDQVSKVTIRWPDRAVVFNRKHVPRGAPEWVAAPGSAASAGIDSARLNSLMPMLSNTLAMRFTQYKGPIPEATGLVPPRVTIEVALSGESIPLQLKIGNPTPGGSRYATTAAGSEGAVFLLTEAEWSNWLAPQGKSELPENVFAPE